MLPQPYIFESPFALVPFTSADTAVTIVPEPSPVIDMSTFTRADLWLLYPHTGSFPLDNLTLLQYDCLDYCITAFGWFTITNGVVNPTAAYRADCLAQAAALH